MKAHVEVVSSACLFGIQYVVESSEGVEGGEKERSEQKGGD